MATDSLIHRERYDAEDGVSRRDIINFLLCLALTVAGGLLLLARVQPTYLGQVLALAAAFLGGTAITIKSVRTLLRRDFGVDVLASVAIWISVLLGEYIAAAIVVIMLNGGELAEDLASQRSSKALEKLIRSAPVTAHIRKNGETNDVSLDKVEIGDIALVRAGEKIPIDGVVVKGTGSVNQSAITGESVPSEKSVGSEVYANTLLENGALDIKVTKRSEETIFAHIVAQVKEAQFRKAPVQRIADRYARWFAPIILLAAIATQLIVKNPLSTAAVLVVSCPCALTLATPIAIIAAIGNAARNGVLIRGGPSLEEAGRCDIVVIDKTGTLTLGSPSVVAVKPLGEHTIDEVLAAAGSAEQRSKHFLANAILERARRIGLALKDPESFQARPGFGVVAELSGHRIVVGNLNLMKEHDIAIDEESTSYIDSESAIGRTPVVVAEDSKSLGIVSIADTLREEVSNNISHMKSTGVKKIIMLTGDNPSVANEIARRVGLNEAYSNLLPDDKANTVEKYRQQGHRVVVVGDGINDGPALAAANVGIAMGIAGTDVAMETAGIVLMTDDLSKISKVMKLSRKVISVIKQNVAFSLAVNIIGLVLSTQGFVSPVLASVVHEGNALIVVFNSLRIFRSPILKT